MSERYETSHFFTKLDCARGGERGECLVLVRSDQKGVKHPLVTSGKTHLFFETGLDVQNEWDRDVVRNTTLLQIRRQTFPVPTHLVSVIQEHPKLYQ